MIFAKMIFALIIKITMQMRRMKKGLLDGVGADNNQKRIRY